MDVHAIPPFSHWRWQAEATLVKERGGIMSDYMSPSSYWASLIAQLVKNQPAMQETLVDSWVGKIHWRKDRLPSPVFMGFPGVSAGKESALTINKIKTGVTRSVRPCCWVLFPSRSKVTECLDYLCILKGSQVQIMLLAHCILKTNLSCS